MGEGICPGMPPGSQCGVNPFWVVLLDRCLEGPLCHLGGYQEFVQLVKFVWKG